MPWDHPHKPNQGDSDEWVTPKYIFDRIGLEYDLDPCMPEKIVPWIPCKKYYDYVDNGLECEWEGRVWLNPPYGRETGLWVKRLAEHNNGIALVFSRTDVKWWHETVPKATAVCFIKGRITFIPWGGQSAPGNSGGPSVLIAYSDSCAKAIDGSKLGITYYARGK